MFRKFGGELTLNGILRSRLSLFRSAYFCLLIVLLTGIGVSVSTVAEENAALPENMLPSKQPLEGWQMQGEKRVFVPENLWEYINGQAEMYINYGFKRVGTASYARIGDSEKTVTVDVYDMGDKLNAFGIYSQMDSGDLKSAGVGIASYVYSPSLAFYKSHYFVSMNAGWIEDDTDDALIKFAKLVDAKIKCDGKPPSETMLLPEENRMPGTLQYIPKSLLGHEFLPRGIEAQYELEGSKVKLFIAFFTSAQDSAKAFDAYKTYIAGKEKSITDENINECKAFSAEEPYQGNVFIALCDTWVLGATHLATVAQGKTLLGKVLSKKQK